MPALIPENLHKKVADRLAFCQDLGIAPFYRDRRAEPVLQQEQLAQSVDSVKHSAQIPHEESTLPKTLRRSDPQKQAASAPAKMASLPLPAAPAPSLFDAADRIADDTLLKVREDLGE